MNTYKVLLYYKYVPVDEPEQLRDEQRALCQELDIKGRILVSHEGINGTVAGTNAATKAYIAKTTADPRFADMEWKISSADEQVFPKLQVKVREEIVTLGVRRTGQDVNLDNKAHYIEPEELLDLYESGEDFVILDARNEYEAVIGKFKNALVPPIDNFREFPQFTKEHLEEYKDKNVVTYCTGGIRCEKASAYLREQGFKKVRQLHGGIHRYGDTTGGKYFEGEMFVFDKRLHTKVNSVNPTVIARCIYCDTPVSRYVDCSEFACGNLFICCESCEHDRLATCSQDCLDKVRAQHASLPEQETVSATQ